LHAEEDKERKEQVEIRNEADSLVFRAQKSLNEYKDKLPKNVVSDIQSHIDGLKKALEGQDNALIKAKTAELQEHMQKIGEELSKAGAQGGPAGAAGPSPSAPKADDVVEEAEVEVLDDEKK
jgi:molecular chaperone DnaK